MASSFPSLQASVLFASPSSFPHVPAAKPIEEKKVEEGKTIITEAITASPKA